MGIGVFEKSSVIWYGKEFSENSYGEFKTNIVYNGGKLSVRLSVCGDYVLFVNGKYVASNQYGDFDHYKIYDDIDITSEAISGNNTICFLVWYFGKTGMRYFTETPGLIYEVLCDGEIVDASSEATLSRQSRAYKTGFERMLSSQLGYSFLYNSNLEDNWLTEDTGDFSKSYFTKKTYNYFARPIHKHILQKAVEGTIIKTDYGYMIDFGREIVGLVSFSLCAKNECLLTFSYGELLKEGRVKRKIGNRDFSFDYVAVKGENKYTNYMLRLACRYIEVECDDIQLEKMSLIPTQYPVCEKDILTSSSLDKDIYDICVNTLRLCMMEHYVDCPWREQCLYAFDSRNQMLSGYCAFEGGNFNYARAMLLLMSKDTKKDNIMSICYPSGLALTIPSFSLYYILAVSEYMDHSADCSLGEEVFDKITAILKAFFDNSSDGLICRFKGENRWNFYDWSEYAWSSLASDRPKEPDFMINAICIVALKAYDNICKKLGRVNVYEGEDERLSQLAHNKFFNPETGLYFINDINEKSTELANSFAVVSGIAKGKSAEEICLKLSSGVLLPCSLSMKTFKYDALLLTDEKRYSQCVLDEIRNTYKIMLGGGTGTVWETAVGAEDFEDAGSLCHGWSAIPIYYYHKLGVAKYDKEAE